MPEYGHEGLVKARNAYSGVLGYDPIKALSAITGAIGAGWQGGGAFVAPDGTVVLLAGTNGGLYQLTSTTSTLALAGAYSAPWFFAQFGSKVVCVNGGAPVKFTLGVNTAVALGGSPPTCNYAAIVRDFTFLAGNTGFQNRVYWSSINNPEAWTIGTNQCDVQDLPDGGPVTGLAGGEFGLAFQDSSVHLFEYVGTPLIFIRRKVSNTVGALCHGSIAQHGRQTFFYSRRGFYKFIDGDVHPIGRNMVDRTFRNTYGIGEIIANMRCTIDPERSLVIWSMPDRLWVYNFDNEMWSDVYSPGIVGITTGRTASLTLEQIAITYPSIETVTPVFDDPFWAGGQPLLMIAQTDGVLYTFGSPNTLEAAFRLPQLEINSGRVSHVRSSRIIGNMTSAQVAMDCRPRMGDPATSVVSIDFRANGEVPIRASGRYIQPEITLGAGTVWSSIQGFEIEAAPGGRG